MFLRITFLIVFIIYGKTDIATSAEFNNFGPFSGESKNLFDKTENLTVNLNGNSLSVKANDVSIKAIVEEIVQVSGIKGWIFGDAQEKITINLLDVSLKEGLKKILKNKSYGFVYNQNKDSKGVLHSIEIKKGSRSRSRNISDRPGVTRKRGKRAKRAKRPAARKGDNIFPGTNKSKNDKSIQNKLSKQLSGKSSKAPKASSPGKAPTDAKKPPVPLATPKYETSGGGATFKIEDSTIPNAGGPK